MEKHVLITRPNYDLATYYLYAGSILNLLLMVCAGLDVLKRKAMTLFSFLKKLYSVESG